ncbi:putative quinol monooxygenase [Congregibacter sp.]|uniref:putative quinol monooxygenase n=1 Tax=Congregibacter sp. TaxID=2744308 RepID=UPI003F6A8A61
MSETVVVHVRAKPGHEAFVEAELNKLIAPTRAEEGCIRYDMFADVEDPLHFVFFEEWHSIDDHQTHLDKGHMAAFIIACKGTLAEASIYNLERR